MKPIILDRDGVINHDSDEFIKSPEEWQPIKGSSEAIARLTQAGYSVIVLSNQSGVGRKLFSADILSQIHVHMVSQIQQAGGQIHSILFCPHHPDDGCGCRKPNTGMYQELANRLNIGFSGIYSVGDSMRDLLAAHRAGATPVLVKTGNGKQTAKLLTKHEELGDRKVAVRASLAAFTDALLNSAA